MADWPVTLPQDPEIQGLVEDAPDGTVRTNMEAGPDKIRRRFTAAPRPFDMSLILTKTQVGTLDDFYVGTLDHGALPFNWHSPRTQSAGEFRFLDRPRYEMVGPDTYRILLKLELMP